jgi:hypothetical protein
MLRTIHKWIDKLAAESPVVASMRLDAILKDAALDTDAFNLANCNAHRQLIARAIEGLSASKSSSDKNTRNLLCSLIARETYGAFAELAAYDWLTRCHIKFATQMDMTPNDVLATAGSTLDGRIDYNGAYFDVKAFGSNGRLSQRLKERLEKEIPGKQILIEESWDLPFETFRDLIEDAPNIAVDLKKRGVLRRGRMNIRLEEKKPVTISSRDVDPYHLAKENALFPFRDAKQFTKNNPFILIFIVHPWFNALSIHNDFGGTDTAFTRSLARRAFMQFSRDTTRLDSVSKRVPPNVTLGDASRLLSAIFFVNVWPKDADPTITYVMPSWLYLNPRATHRLTNVDAGFFRAASPNGTHIDTFVDDDY